CDFSANGYRLPTEAEWEYAARGGIHFSDNYRYSGCHEGTDLMNYAWFDSDGTSYTNHPVGTKMPNQLGIYDMSGNQWEWCWDWYGSTYYQTCFNQGTVTDPKGPTAASTGTSRVLRGGDAYNEAVYCRVASRYYYGSFGSNAAYGFRIARTK
ncbi:MAG: formylglycine-generating enzyme family protein, partial [Candidatus Delongbacteria bacterium]